MNKAVFDKLPKPQQDALIKAGERTPSSQYRAEIRGFESVLFGMHEKAGGQIVTLTPEQREVWRKALEPNHQKVVDEIGGGAKTYFAAMEAGRKACAK